ncbi:TetR/AcrR family transcriptional regulator [Streptomyces sp. NPDC005435]|uniref:TetR/AcrR family transcriptional regulator n=1 Tax=Streptomyces sp. NPDC005435 TaxID=3154464 RepID=UPI003451E83E
MRPSRHKTIIEAARAEIVERGYAAVSIRDIAQRAGMSMSALYHYYPGKQALLMAILDEGVDAFFTACQEALAEAGDDPAERLEALVTATVRFRAEHPAKSAITLSEERSLEPGNQERYQRRLGESTRLFQAIVEDGVAEGLFNTPYPEDARRAIIAMCNAIGQWYRADGPLTLDDLAERYVALALTLVEYRPRAVRRTARPKSSG